MSKSEWTGVETLAHGERQLLVRSATLRVVRGPDAGKEVHLDGPLTTVGKAGLSDLRLSDPSVSREHATFSLGPGGVTVQDRGSKNGTWLGPVRVERVVLTQDTALRLGDTHLDVVLDGADQALSLSEEPFFGRAIGQSTVMRHLFAYLARAAPEEVSVLLEGESGVGKEVLSRAIHDASPRASGPFVPVDCGAIPANLIESELFGHVRGAFTGAEHARVGLFEQASGGTIFLDELGELPLDLQPKLLRVLEERTVRPVGSNETRPVDVRVVAATNRSLLEEARAGRFREDLYYRVAVVRVRVPPLRERPEDVALLATRILEELSGDGEARFPADILAMLQAYPWPGNVRELKNVVGRFALLDARTRADLFDGSLARPVVRSADEDYSHLPFHEARRLVLEQLEARYIPAIFERAGGVASRAAELAGISRSSFYRMAERSVGSLPQLGSSDDP